MSIFSYPLFLIPASSGLIFCIVGLIMYYFPPKHINGWYGYRTARSMKNQAHWDFAQRYSAKTMLKGGSLLMVIGCCGLWVNLREKTATLIGLGVLIGLVVIVLIRVERALAKRFDSK